MSRRILTGTALAVSLLMIVTSLPLWRSPYLFEQGDLAANALQVERAHEGRELLGPYSQNGFHHPGPVSFYYQALSEPVFFPFPSLLGRHLAAQLIMNLAMMVCAIWLLGRAGLEPLLGVASIFLMAAPLLFLGGGNMFLLASVWGPLVVVMPMVLFVAATARIADGDLEALPPAAFAATVSWHTHVLTIAPLLLLSTMTALWLLRTRPPLAPALDSRRGRTLWVSSALILMAGLAPVLIEEFSGSPGNLTLMWSFLRHHAPTVHPWPEVTRKLGQAFTDPLVVLHPRWSSSPAIVPATLIIAGCLLAVSVVQFLTSARAWRLVIAFTWTTMFTAFGCARYVYGELHSYLFYYLYGMVGILYVMMARECRRRWRTASAGAGQGTEIVVALLGLALLTPWLLTHRISAPPARDEFAIVKNGLPLADIRSLHIQLGADEKDDDLWVQVPNLALRFRREGVHVTVDERFVVVCGEEMRAPPGGPHTLTLLLSHQPSASGQTGHVSMGGWHVFLLPGAK